MFPGAKAFATGLVFPFVLAAASSAAMIAAGAATRKSRIPSGPYMTGAAAVILASPLARLPAGNGRRTNGPGFVLRIHGPARMAAIS
jgi:hypothetical protein